MRSAKSHMNLVIALLLPLIFVRVVVLAQDEGTREVGRTTESELKVTLTSSFGTVKISRGEPEKMVVVQSSSGEGQRMSLDYSIRSRVGYLDLTLGEGEPTERRKEEFLPHH